MTTSPPPTIQETGLWAEVARMGWAEFRPLEALACLPAIILLLASGLA